MELLVDQKFGRKVLRAISYDIDGKRMEDRQRDRQLALFIYDILVGCKEYGYRKHITKNDRVLAGMLYPEFMAADSTDESIRIAEQLRRSLVEWANIDEDRVRYIVEG